VDEYKSPEETLQDYFDDLFTGADGTVVPAQPLHISEPQVPVDDKPVAHSSVSRTSRPSTRPLTKSIEPSRYQAPAAALPSASYAEPDILPQHKAKVEKLLEAARVQLKPNVQLKPKVATTKAPVTVPEPVEPVEAKAAVEFRREIEAAAEPDVELALEPEFELEGLVWEANGRPPWAQGNFDVLLFKVSGLTLAVPLVALGQIQPITEALTPIFGQADWFMGFQPTTLGKIRTVNTALFVMPERYDEEFLKTAKLVISINGLEWGLAVDSVNQPITLSPDAVKWRSERSKRPWLAGTVKEQMCALIDVPMMGKLLLEADTNTYKV